MTPAVSIIVPAFNQEKWIAETLDSVLAQSIPDWECIVVNDGSTDGTEAIARSYAQKDARIKVVCQANGGLSAARNTGIRASQAEFILPLDADDKIAPEYLKKALARFKAHPNTKLVYCKAEYFGQKTGPWELLPYNYKEFLLANCIFCSCMYRRSDYNSTPGYDESMKKGWEDWDFLLHLLGPEDVVYQIPEVLFYYRIRQSSVTSVTKQNEEDLLWDIIQKHPDKYKKYLYKLRTKYFTDRHNPDLAKEKKLGHILFKPVRIIRSLKNRH